MKKINWGKVWRDFDEWVISHKRPDCPKCHRSNSHYPEWEDQVKKIQSLVEAQLKRKVKRGS